MGPDGSTLEDFCRSSAEDMEPLAAGLEAAGLEPPPAAGVGTPAWRHAAKDLAGAVSDFGAVSGKGRLATGWLDLGAHVDSVTLWERLDGAARQVRETAGQLAQASRRRSGAEVAGLVPLQNQTRERIESASLLARSLDPSTAAGSHALPALQAAPAEARRVLRRFAESAFRLEPGDPSAGAYAEARAREVSKEGGAP